MSVNYPVSQLKNVTISFTESGFNYTWYFDYYGNPNNLTLTWDDDGDPNLPLIMNVGDTKTLTLTPSVNLVSIEPVTRNHNVVRISDSSVEDDLISVTIKALEAGQTSITIAGRVEEEGEDSEGNPLDLYMLIATYPREIWVAKNNPATGKREIPGLTKDLDALIEKMTSEDVISGGTEGGGGWYTPITDPEESEVPGDTEDAINIINGLSVKPRYVRPSDPEGDAYSTMLDYLYVLDSEEDAFTFEDYVNVVKSIDVKALFNAISTDLLSEDPRQILALVLPEIKIDESNWYVFRVPVDNITRSGSAIFWYSDYAGYEDNLSASAITDDEAIESMSEDKYIFLDDDGQPLNVIAGEKYINVAAYLTEGNHKPIITAEATENDCKIIYNISDPKPAPDKPKSDDIKSDDIKPGSDDVKPDSDDIKPDSQDIKPAPGSEDVKPTPIPAPDSQDVRPAPDSQDITPAPIPAPGSQDVNPAPDSQDVEPGHGGGTITSPDTVVEPQPVKPETPKVDITKESVITQILDVLQNISALITGDTEILELPENAAGQERTLDDVSDEDLAQIPDNQEPAAILPAITVDEPGVYVFGISLEGIEGLEPGMKIFLFLFGKSNSESRALTISAANSNDDAYTFLDDDGKEITTIPQNMHVNIAAYMEPGYTYQPIVTAEVSSSSNEPEVTPTYNGGGGGCNAGLSLAGLLLLGLFINKRKD